MKHLLNAGLVGKNEVWEELLKGWGVPFDVLEPEKAGLSPHRVFIFQGERIQSGVGLAEALLKKGVSILAPDTWGLKDPRDPKAVYNKVLVYREHDIREFCDGASAPKSFECAGRQVTERVALLPKKRVRGVLWQGLLEAYRLQDLWCPRLSCYPKGFRSMFCLRVDADEYDAELFGRFLKSAKPYARSMSLFFNASNYAGGADTVRKCREAGFDIHSHGWIHHTYDSNAQNLFNIRKSLDFFNKIDVQVSGYCAPYGKWTPSLQRVFEQCGFSFASEFSCDYDDLPLFPWVGDRPSTVLQVPVHPVCLGIYFQSGMAYEEEKIASYYRNVMDEKIKAGDPVIFYDHPTRYLGVYGGFIPRLYAEAAARREVWIASMSDWAAFWKARHKVRYEVTEDTATGFVSVNRIECPQNLVRERLALEIYDGNTNRVTLADFKEGPVLTNPLVIRWLPFSREVAKDRGETIPVSEDVLDRLKRWIDWERQTPRRDLVVDSLPSAVKSALRHMLR